MYILYIFFCLSRQTERQTDRHSLHSSSMPKPPAEPNVTANIGERRWPVSSKADSTDVASSLRGERNESNGDVCGADGCWYVIVNKRAGGGFTLAPTTSHHCSAPGVGATATKALPMHGSARASGRGPIWWVTQRHL
jgi:hypothetical protein